jgi:hypothetical protein
MRAEERHLKRKTILLDVDDTLLKTDTRKLMVWHYITGQKIPQLEVESLSSKEILEKYYNDNRDLWFKFWRNLLCFDKSGEKFLKFDQPMPHAAEVVCEWSKDFSVSYITGRTENMCELTVNELRSFGFPVDEDDLYMYSEIADSLESALEVRGQLVNCVALKKNITCIVDDNPRYFPVYANSKIPLRIGLLRTKRYQPKDYRKASIVVNNWLEVKSINLKNKKIIGAR